MKKKLLSQKILLSLALMTLCFNAIFGQQTIGEFPTIDGGFETQIITNIGFITPRATEWTISTSPASTAARSKQQYLL